MQDLGSRICKADWKTEKHVPVIECPDTVKAGEVFEVRVSLGRETSHPNTTEHHIRWVSLHFHPEGAKFPYQVGLFEFLAHGESTDGPNQGPVYTDHSVAARMRTDRPGVLQALAFCNITACGKAAENWRSPPSQGGTSCPNSAHRSAE